MGQSIKWYRIRKKLVYLTDFDMFCFFFKIMCRIFAMRMKNLFLFRNETVTVTVEQGDLLGRKMNSIMGKPYFSFLGVPYAQPPVGPLRFKDPQPPQKWNGVREALKLGNICIHKDFITGMVRGSEDCLFLNVYTPQLPEKVDPNYEGKAVMFWVHGGGFQVGSGNNDAYSPDFLLSEDIILVTINYRLGVLGFLSAGTDDAPGNAGLKDMVMALKWVNKNIAAFGGDPDKITIFGESAGAAAIQYLLLSPSAKGLFSGAISQSGNAGASWAFNPSAVDSAFKLGRAFGCDTDDPKVLLETLRKIPAKVLATKQNAALSEANKRECIPFEFVPSAEPKDYSNAFITKHPRELIQQGTIASDVPYICGINEMEGMAWLKLILDKSPREQDIEEDFERLVPRFLNLQYRSDKSKEVAAKMREFYFQGEAFDKTKHKDYVDLTTDIHFLEGFNLTTRSHVKHMNSPIYNYLFKFEGENNIFKKLLNVKNIPGPAHADELFYIFYAPVLGLTTHPRTREMNCTKKLIRMWTNFAKYGNPTPDAGDEVLENVVWPRARVEDYPYLVIDDHLSTDVNIMSARTEFWEDLKEVCWMKSRL